MQRPVREKRRHQDIRYVENNKQYPEHSNQFGDRGFYRAWNICILGLQDAPWFICHAVCSMVHRYFSLWHIYDCRLNCGGPYKADNPGQIKAVISSRKREAQPHTGRLLPPVP